MDIIEVNKISGNRRVKIARDNMYSKNMLNVDDSLTLIVYACKKMYGLNNTVKLIHGIGVKKL